MMVRFGYVAMALKLEDCSPSKTVTLKTFQRLSQDNPIAARAKLLQVSQQNLQNSLRILKYNVAYGVHVYRFSSKLIPLATHPLVQDWNYLDDLRTELAAIGEYIQQHQLRVSFHPDHFTVLNSPHPQVIASSIKDLWYHHHLLSAMGLNHNTKLIMHVGGMYKEKDAATQRFMDHFLKLPSEIAKRIVLENDDKIYTAQDVLNLCQQLHIPMVLDVHHHRCYSQGEDLAQLLPQIFATWHEFRPKVHLSTPKDAKNYRSHADLIDVDETISFLTTAKETINQDFDIMIEAKKKDQALFDLMDKLKTWTHIRFVDPTTIEI